jgi:ETFB lysine methyltransferase
MSTLRIRYQTFEFGHLDIHVRTLRDTMQFLDIDGIAEKSGISSATWPIFGVVWDSGIVLANYMLSFKVDEKRILEVGCGIALASLVLNERSADITATDHHPEAGAFLMENIRLNNGNQIPFLRTGWDDLNGGLGEFDVIIGSDVLYERGHAELLAGFIDKHAKTRCEVIIVDPGRGQLGRFGRIMMDLGYAASNRKPSDFDNRAQQIKCHILNLKR